MNRRRCHLHSCCIYHVKDEVLLDAGVRSRERELVVGMYNVCTLVGCPERDAGDETEGTEPPQE